MLTERNAGMKKILLLLILIFLTSCSARVNETELKGISVFNKDENLIDDFIPEGNVYIHELSQENYSRAAIICDTGLTVLFSSDNYIGSDSTVYATAGQTKFENIEGIYLTNDYQSITNAYFHMIEYLGNEEKVMAVLLDGFSYNQFKMAVKEGSIPFLSKYFKYPALSVYTPVTNAGFAAIITGETPNVNGVHDRSVREMRVKSIFAYCLENNKNSILLEGDIKVLNTEIEPELHIDNNKNGETDDEVYESALKAVNENYDLVFIHFHGIDDRGHSFGPYSDETMEYIKAIDQYIETLGKVWDGAIIIAPDHGMHETDEGGGHGICVQSDIIVPYFIKEP
ncbi:MAG TPA: hypothetical protein DC024_01110 [Clostridiales bacterium]|jgi:predicted AlkP superfamily pyrophosphatase or phosphodiesterase|nr:hypothetical protein [Clostridiales bacterium]